jgi:hypothetical protein
MRRTKPQTKMSVLSGLISKRGGLIRYLRMTAMAPPTMTPRPPNSEIREAYKKIV